jgi:serine/threonine protein kinase/class 3 adenylate cyclase
MAMLEPATQFGDFVVAAPAGAGPAGPIFSTADGLELRTLGRAQENPRVWAALTRRLALLKLLDHPAALKPVHADLRHDPPFLVVPTSRPLDGTLPNSLAGIVLPDFTAFLAAAHRVGLTLGSPHRTTIRVTADGRMAFDATGTADGCTPADLMAESDPAADVAWLGKKLEGLFGAAAFDREGKAVLAKMQATLVEDRPLAEEVAAKFRPIDPSMTMETEAGNAVPDAVDLAATSDAGNVVAPEATPPPAVGDTLGRFVLLEKIGEGGVGVVFRAEDPVDGAVVAVKVLRNAVRASDTARRRFVKEARLLGSLDTPFVTRLVEANAARGHCYMALEFVAGQSVGDLLKGVGRLDEPTALGMIADAARGLAAAHAVGIVHRDMKPDNLLVSQHGAGRRVKVGDFGLARPVVQSESLEVTQAGAVLGTPLYMAPEQFGKATVGPQADVYSLGATLFHMLAGRPPFPADSLPALARAVASEAPPPLERVAPDASTAVAALVARCLSKEPGQRPPDADAFLREVERLISGAPSDLATHPRLPAGSRNVREYVHTWELAASPAQLWPYVSNTERLNRAAGLPSVSYEIRRDPQLGTRRFASARVGGMKMEWEEHPFEWVEGRRMGVLREFSRGPFVWFVSVVDLDPLPGGGTRLRQTLRAEPRNLLGKIAARVELGAKSARNLGRVYRRIDEVLTAKKAGAVEDAFEVPTRLTGPRQRLLRDRVAKLVERGVPPDAADLLGLYVSNAPEQEAARIRPIALARRFNLDEAAITDACLRAVGEGLLELKWDLICPLCRIPAGRKDTLRELKDHENCTACDKSFAADFAGAVEAVFRVHPDVRRAEPGTYCAGGPAHSPHVVAQTRVAPGERVELELPLSEGVYQLRGPQLAQKVELRIEAGAAVRRWELDLAALGVDPPPRLAAGGIVLSLRNGSPHEIIARIERAVPRDDVLTAARAVSLPAFRELFPGELLAPGQLAPASVVTLLLAEIDGGEALFDTLGESEAFQTLQAAFRAMEERVKAEGGVVLKTVGAGVVAAFADADAGARTAFLLPDALANNPLTRSLKLKAALHRGLAYVVTMNDRLDYFGQTPLVAARLLRSARGNEVAVSPAAADDPAVERLLRGRPTRLAELRPGDRRMLVRYVALRAE